MMLIEVNGTYKGLHYYQAVKTNRLYVHLLAAKSCLSVVQSQCTVCSSESLLLRRAVRYARNTGQRELTQ